MSNHTVGAVAQTKYSSPKKARQHQKGFLARAYSPAKDPFFVYKRSIHPASPLSIATGTNPMPAKRLPAFLPGFAHAIIKKQS